jgi:hypothetical protein
LHGFFSAAGNCSANVERSAKTELLPELRNRLSGVFAGRIR